MTIYKLTATVLIPSTYRIYLERHYKSDTFKGSLLSFLKREPMPPIKGGSIRFTPGNIQKIIKIFKPYESDPFYGAIIKHFLSYPEGESVEIDSRSVIDVPELRQKNEQHNVRILPRDYEFLEALRTKHQTKALSRALRKEIEEDALRHGFRLHPNTIRTPSDEF